jgi:hypothetical protein
MKNLNLSERPINVLILLDEIIYVTMMTLMAFNLCVVMIGQQTPLEFLLGNFGTEINESVSALSYVILKLIFILELTLYG